MTDNRQFEPYGVYQGHSTTRESVEAEPPTQPSPTSHGTWRWRTDAGTDQKLTEEAEEEEVAVSNFYCSSVPHVIDCSSDVIAQIQIQREPDRERSWDKVRRLQEWLAARRGTRGIPSHEVAIKGGCLLDPAELYA